MFCKFCGRPLGQDAYCGHCGKENALVGRSTELEALMRGCPAAPQPEAPAPGKTYQQGLTEGFANGRNEGYETGVKDGYDAGLKHAQGMRWIGAAVAAVLLLAGVISGVVGNRSGYNSGLAAGEQNGRQAAEAAYADAAAKAQREYESRLSEQYQSGYEQGKLDAQAAMSALDPRDDVIKQGDRGDAVKTIQRLLISKGWQLEADGKYGNATAGAVRAFQGLNGLEETGEVNLPTYWALLSDASLGVAATIEEPAAPGSMATPTVLFPEEEPPSDPQQV